MTTVSAEPILIGSHSVLLKFFAMPRNADDPKRIEGTLTLVGPEGVLTLDALVGPKGNPGVPSPIIRPQWGSSVTDPGDLPEVSTLDETDDGRAWFIAGQWHVYSDTINDYHVIEGSIPGPPGATPDISISAEGIDPGEASVYGPIEVEETGTSTSPNFHFKIPMVPGPEGPASAIRLASDYDNSDPPEHGAAIVWDDDAEKWKPANPTLFAPKKWSIPHTGFVAYTGSAGRQLIGSLNIPPQDFDWYPDVIGHVILYRGFLATSGVEIEVRIGKTGESTGETEPLCGKAPYDPIWALLDSSFLLNIAPHFSDDAYPGRAVSPDASTGRCLAGDAMTIYVFTHRVSGFGDYVFNRNDAQLRVNVEPIV